MAAAKTDEAILRGENGLGKLLREKVENADIDEELFHLVSLKT
jgi:hypothetical protein